MSEPMTEAVQSTRGFNCIFIHSSLDDAGLTSEQFRVLAHLSRRAGDGAAWASNATMAEKCRLHPDTVVACLKELERRRMIRREARPGKTTVVKIMPPNYWDLAQPAKLERNGRAASRPADPPETKGGPSDHPPETKGGHPPETKGGEGNPPKVIPNGAGAPAAKEPAAKRQLTDGWVAGWEKRFGGPYKFEGAKDGKAADALLATGLTVASLLKLAAEAWDNVELFNCKHAMSLAGFASRFNEIRGELIAKRQPKRPAQQFVRADKNL